MKLREYHGGILAADAVHSRFRREIARKNAVVASEGESTLEGRGTTSLPRWDFGKSRLINLVVRVTDLLRVCRRGIRRVRRSFER